jgi:hypothetical protein
LDVRAGDRKLLGRSASWGLGVFRESGASVEWPAGDLSLLLLLAVWCGLSWVAVHMLAPYADSESLPGVGGEAA